MKFIGNILPIDGYYIVFNESLPKDYSNSLTHLYQPLIGIKAIALYQTLFNEMELQESAGIQTHHTLMNYLNLPLNELYEARLQLEGIGLLKTYEAESADQQYYTYELKSPFAPNEFFENAMLSELLYHHIGQAKYRLLQRRYLKELTKNKGKDITASFQNVFHTFKPTVGQSDQIEQKKKNERNYVDNVDFSWLEIILKQRMIPTQQVLTEQNKKLISEMMFLYDLATFEIEKIILWALTEENKLDAEEFRKSCHDSFKTKQNNSNIKLVAKNTESKQDSVKDNVPQTKEEQLIQQFETISPKQLLEDLSSGNQASSRELKMISDIMTKQGLPAPVMNVLIHYVLIQSNMKLSKAYLETIASHWSRARLNSAKEAMNFAKTEISKFQKSGSRKYYNQKRSTKEVIPDWFKERNKKPKENNTVDPQSEQKREELAALIKEFANED